MRFLTYFLKRGIMHVDKRKMLNPNKIVDEEEKRKRRRKKKINRK
jgi:hypothetical protein